jgi:hypothetical protein
MFCFRDLGAQIWYAHPHTTFTCIAIACSIVAAIVNWVCILFFFPGFAGPEALRWALLRPAQTPQRPPQRRHTAATPPPHRRITAASPPTPTELSSHSNSFPHILSVIKPPPTPFTPSADILTTNTPTTNITTAHRSQILHRLTELPANSINHESRSDRS